MHTARIVIGTVLALALSGISIVCCYIFGTHLAPGDEGRLYGVLGAVADGFKAILPIGIAVALASKQRARAGVGIVLFLVFTAYSFASELGLYALSRDAQATSTTAGKESLAFLKGERERIQERLKALGQTRPSGTIRGDIAAQRQNRLWEQTKQCSEATWSLPRTFCADLEKLTGELAAADEAEKLRTKDSELATKMEGIDLASVLKSADPQSEALGRLTGFAPSTIKDSLAILVALLIELGSGFGLFAATASAASAPVPVGRKPEKPKVSTVPSSARSAETKRLEKAEADGLRQFLRECVRTASGAETGAGELYEAYQKWASADGSEPIGATLFGRRLTDMGYAKAKRGGKVRYQGVALTKLRLAVNN